MFEYCRKYIYLLIPLLISFQGCLLQNGMSDGTIKGKVIMEDGGDPSSASLEFIFNSTLEKTITPKADGNFSVSLKEGVYSVEVSAKGYDSQSINNVQSLAGTSVMSDITLKVSAGNVTVKFVDGSGNAISGLKLNASEDANNQNGFASFTTNSVGEIVIPGATYHNYGFFPFYTECGNHGSVLIDSNCGQAGAYIQTFGSHADAAIVRKANQDQYQVRVRKLLFADGKYSSTQMGYEWREVYSDSYGTHFGVCFTPTTHFVAQQFSPSNSINMCQVGFGLFGPSPNKLSIYTDNSNQVGTSLVDRTITSRGSLSSWDGIASTTFDQMGFLVNFCDNGSGPVTLMAGQKYWIVGSYDEVPGSSGFSGASGLPSTGVNVLMSDDGVTWGTAVTGSGTNFALAIFLTD